MVRPSNGEPPAQGWSGPRAFAPIGTLALGEAKEGASPLRPETRPEVAERTAQAIPVPSRAWPHRRFLPAAIPGDPGSTGLYPGEPATCRRDLARFLPIWAHLALLVAVLKVYRVEGRALFVLAGLALAALPVHYLLSYRWKKPFFLGLSVVGLFAVFGVAAGLAVSGVAVALIGVCRLPIAWVARASIVGGVALLLGFARASTLGAGSPVLDVFWPVLGSMLMFRMILYLYEIKHAERPEPWVDAFGYFFLLPNYCFLHFPVVDYRTLARSHFAVDIHDSQRSGLRMIFKGVVHLLAYRLVYHELLIPADEVRSVATLVGFIACNYLLYLQVSGQFHLACGMLHLFGYNLPLTHNNYLLASGFTDYWRRINIYWKDFMVRVVFNPVAFRLKRKPRWLTLAVATSAVFLATWTLHAYQKFWLRGTWGFSVPDALFWGILGALVLVNVQLDARETPRDRRRSPRGKLAALALRSAKTAATFATIAILWSLWSSPSVDQWFAMFRRAF